MSCSRKSLSCKENGWGGIRTPGGLTPTAVFKTDADSPQAQEPQAITAGGLTSVARSVALLQPEWPDLALVAEQWETLPDAFRAGIVAMVKAAAGRP
jgi:hypothetical protein